MRNYHKKSKVILILVILIIVIFILGIFGYIYYNNKSEERKVKDKINEINSHYNQMVITSKRSAIYKYIDDKYTTVGSIEKGVLLSLKEQKIDENTKYFTIDNLDEDYYINYNDVEKSNEVFKEKDERYKRYIPFNLNIKSDLVNLYKNGKLVYSFEKEMSLPIYIKEDDVYYVEYNDELYEVKKDEVEVVENHNTDETNTKGIGTLNYHFFWDDDTEKQSDCSQIICHSKSQFKKQLDYIRDNNIFTLKMKELELYIDGKIQLPRSVVITIDDGWRSKLGIEILNEYKLNGTLFLITGDYYPKDYESEYVELHSHTDKLHVGGKCPGGQGGGIKCLPRDEILNDLKTSREKLNGSTVLCYPFYEYNNYSIEIAKEAGFTMAFAGESSNSNNLTKVGSNKFKLPRFVVVTYTAMNDFIRYIG